MKEKCPPKIACVKFPEGVTYEKAYPGAPDITYDRISKGQTAEISFHSVKKNISFKIRLVGQFWLRSSRTNWFAERALRHDTWDSADSNSQSVGFTVRSYKIQNDPKGDALDFLSKLLDSGEKSRNIKLTWDDKAEPLASLHSDVGQSDRESARNWIGVQIGEIRSGSNELGKSLYRRVQESVKSQTEDFMEKIYKGIGDGLEKATLEGYDLSLKNRTVF